MKLFIFPCPSPLFSFLFPFPSTMLNPSFRNLIRTRLANVRDSTKMRDYAVLVVDLGGEEKKYEKEIAKRREMHLFLFSLIMYESIPMRLSLRVPDLRLGLNVTNHHDGWALCDQIRFNGDRMHNLKLLSLCLTCIVASSPGPRSIMPRNLMEDMIFATLFPSSSFTTHCSS